MSFCCLQLSRGCLQPDASPNCRLYSAPLVFCRGWISDFPLPDTTRHNPTNKFALPPPLRFLEFYISTRLRRFALQKASINLSVIVWISVNRQFILGKKEPTRPEGAAALSSWFFRLFLTFVTDWIKGNGEVYRWIVVTHKSVCRTELERLWNQSGKWQTFLKWGGVGASELCAAPICGDELCHKFPRVTRFQDPHTDRCLLTKCGSRLLPDSSFCFACSSRKVSPISSTTASTSWGASRSASG